MRVEKNDYPLPYLDFLKLVRENDLISPSSYLDVLKNYDGNENKLFK